MADIWNTIRVLAADKVDNKNPPPSPPPQPPNMTKAQILSIVAKLQEVGLHNGFAGIAKSEPGVKLRWVKMVERARQRRIRQLARTEAEVEPTEIE